MNNIAKAIQLNINWLYNFKCDDFLSVQANGLLAPRDRMWAKRIEREYTQLIVAITFCGNTQGVCVHFARTILFSPSIGPENSARNSFKHWIRHFFLFYI